MIGPPTAVRIALLLHRASLWVHPRPFRQDFGAELMEAFAARAEEAFAAGGTWRVVTLLLRSVGDTLVTAVVERRTLRTPIGAGRVDWNRARSSGGGEVMRSIVQDLLVGVRMLSRRPVFAAAAITTLALGIGANTAIFSVVNGVLLRPLPFPEPDGLVRLYHADGRSGRESRAFSLPDREDWAARSTSLAGVAVYSSLPSGLLLTGGDEAVEVRTAYVSAGFFDVLGRDALLGRVLLDEEERGDNQVVVLSHGFWQRRFGGDETVVGSQIQMDDTGFRVAGVMPPDFLFPAPDIEAWVFLSIIPPSSTPLHIRQVRFLDAIGRIAPGTTHDQAAAELSAVAASLAIDFPEDNEGLDAAAIVPLRESITGDVGPTLMLLLGAVGLVLLIACANVANLLLSRALERGRELEIRRALGAGRGRLVRQLMTESLFLSVAGGVAGVTIAIWLTSALLGASDGSVPRSSEVGVDPVVLLFSLGLTVLAAMTCGLLPALKATDRAGASGLQSASRGGVRRPGTAGTWGVLVASQVGLATLVVVASGLLLRSLWALQTVEVGLESERLVALSLTINDARYPERPAYLAAYGQLMERLEELPDVESVASIRYLPLRRSGESTDFELVDRPVASDGASPSASLLQVSPGFFATAGTPLLAGREFTDDDRPESPPVVIINEALRRQHWPDQSPVGSFIVGPRGARTQVVGVVGDIRQRSLAEDPRATLYVPQAQNPRRGMAFVVRTGSDPRALVPDVVAAVHSVDPDQPIENVSVMGDVVHASTAQPRFFSALLASFAFLSLVLATLGIYGVVSHSVSRRGPEIGIRVALGAPRAGVAAMVVAGGMRPVAIGAGVGIAASLFATRFMSAVMYGVSAVDPATFVTVPLLLLVAALLACLVPAARAVRIDPTAALRSE